MYTKTFILTGKATRIARPWIVILIGTLAVSACNPAIVQISPNSSPMPEPLLTTYYVDASLGSDSNPGSQAQPWRTIGKINSRMSSLRPGDSILFKRGEVWMLNSGGEAGMLSISAKGIAGSPITFRAYGTGNLPVIDGTYQNDAREVAINNSAYVIVENLDIYNAMEANISINSNGDNSSFITIQNNIIRTNRTDGYTTLYITNSGAQGNTHDIVISNNIIHDSQWNGMRLTGGVLNAVISGNTIYNISHNGIDTYPSGNNNKNFKIFSNLVYDFGSAGGAGIYIPGASFFEIHNNNIHDSLGVPSYGIKSGSVDGFLMDNITVRNNVIWNVVGKDNNTYGLWFDSCTDCSALNNTLYGNHGTILTLNNVRLSIENNLAYANSRDQPLLRNFTQNPLFVDPTTGDFHLQSNSPACTMGAFPC